MQSKKELAVVIPVYNEERNITSLIHDWQHILTRKNISFSFIIVNDGSTDGSLSLLQDLQQTIPSIILISHSNRGHGPSLLVAYQQACTYEWVFQIDADHEYDTHAFADWWEHRQQYDFLLGERKERNAGMMRKLISLLSLWIVHALYGKSVKDVNSPYRLMRGCLLQEVLKKIPAGSFAPNILITGFFVLKRKRIYMHTVEKRENARLRKSKMNLYFARGCIVSIFQTIRFRFKL